MALTGKTLQQLHRELRQKDVELKQKDVELRRERRLNKEKDMAMLEKDKIILEKDEIILEHESRWDADVLERGGPARYMHVQQTLHDILNNSDRLESVTSFNLEQFEHIYKDFEKAARKAENAPLFADDDRPDPGNRCVLSRKQVLLLTMTRKRRGNVQVQLATMFGVDQATVCRYLQFADPILESVLPTADKVGKRIRAAKTEEELEELVPGKAIIIDGTHTPIQRPKDGDRRKETYSGKKKRFTENTTIITNMDGLVIYAGPPHHGSTHDLTMLR